MAASGGGAPPSIRGYVDGVLGGVVIGWCLDPRDTSQRLTAEVLIDGIPVAHARADLLREPLARDGYGDGRYGFRVPLPERLADGGVHGVEVRAGGAPLAPVPDFIRGARAHDGDGVWHTTKFDPEPEPRPAVGTALVPGAPSAPARRRTPLPSGVAGRLRALGRISPDGCAVLAIAAAVVLANVPYLLDFFDPNPLGPVSGLTSSVSGGVLGGTHVLDPNIGYTSQALGHRAALDLVRLQLPWWNPYEATGAPLAAEMQSAALFPPTLLLIFNNGQFYEHMLLELLAGIATLMLLRRLGVRRWASTLGGIAFALNGTFAWFGHAAVNPVAFLPLVLLGLELAYARTIAGAAGGWWVISVAGALSVYAGFPETAFIDGVLAVVWVLWRCRSGGRHHVRAFLGKVAAGGVAGGLLAAPLLIPFVRFLPDAYLAAHGTRYASVHLPALGLAQLVLPYVYGNPNQYADPAGTLPGLWAGTGGYLTVSLVVLACFGLAARGTRAPRGLRLVLGAWLVLALTRIYGVAGIGQLLNLLPNMPSTEFSRYGWPVVELPMILLAAFGLDALADGLLPRRRLIQLGGLGLAIVAAAGVLAYGLVGQPSSGHPLHSFAVGVAWGVVAVAALTWAARLRDRRARIYLVSALVAVDMIAMFALPELSAPESVRVDLAPVRYLQAHLGLERFMALSQLRPDYGAYFGTASINDIDLPLPEIWATYVTHFLDPYARPNQFIGNRGHRAATAPSAVDELVSNVNSYRAASVAYVVASSGVKLPDPRHDFTLVFSSHGTWIYKLAGTSPYFSDTAHACVITADSRESASVSCSEPSDLVRNETFLNGWSVQVDGRSEPIQEAGIFQEVRLERGRHRVIFSYSPPDIHLAFAAFALGLIWLVLGARRSRFRRRGVPAGV